jgi:hypothetical protein
MKRKTTFGFALLIALACLPAIRAEGLSASRMAKIEASVADVRLPELPATAAQIVFQASDAEKTDVAVAVVKSILADHPATAAAIVGAIAKVAPEISPKVAATAAELVPVQAAQIARAAAITAPKESGRIAVAVSKVVPKSRDQIMQFVLKTGLTSVSEVVAAVLSDNPVQQEAIAKDLAPRLRRASAGLAGTPSGNVTITIVGGFIRDTITIEVSFTDPVTGVTTTVRTTLNTTTEFTPPPQLVLSGTITLGVTQARDAGVPDGILEYIKAH